MAARLALAFACAWLAGCDDESLPHPAPAALTITNAPTELMAIGDTVRLEVEVRDQYGRAMEGRSVVWTSDDPSVATVSGSGGVAAVGVGEATVTAQAGAASASVQLSVADPEYWVLFAFAHSTGFDEWTNADGWLESQSLGDWYGVDVDSVGRVQGLRLPANNVTGRIPPELGDLAHLEELDLSGNEIGGKIPPELGELANLKDLDLSGNELGGAIPTELGDLGRLELLHLADNELEGAIPAELGGAAALEELWLQNNDLSGAIPPELGALANLEFMELRSNAFTGAIPPELGELAALEWLNLSDNDLSGPIPAAIGNLSELEFLWLSHNELDGPIPPEFGDLDVLGGLWLSHNALSGSVPEELAAASNLGLLLIGDNPLSGPLPVTLTGLDLQTFGYAGTDLCVPGDDFQAWLESILFHEGTGIECTPMSDRDILVRLYEATDGPNWTNSENWLTDAPIGEWYGVEADSAGHVTWLSLSSNDLSGPIPPELGGLANLTRLGLSFNDLSGPIPPELGGLADLTRLHLSSNDLSGPIPPELGGLADLTGLHLSSNDLSGPIPPELGGLANLTVLDLKFNDLSGPIPPELGGLADLTTLALYSNDLSGPIPPELGGLANLTTLDLPFNDLSGPIPPELGGLADLTWLSLSGNDLSGPIPPELGGLADLTFLHLSGNDLSDPIPPELGGLADLTWLSLSGNDLSDPIPPELGGLADLTWLSLSGNDLSGPIPPELGGLADLTILDLSGNDLSGPIPRSFLQLDRLVGFYVANNEACVPGISGFLAWLRGIEDRDDESEILCNAADMAVLASLYESTDGSSWTESGGWLGEGEVEAWYGVTADSLGRVTELDLTANGLDGQLPGTLGDLARATELRVGGNAALTGRLPLSLVRLSLQVLHYAGTDLCAPADAEYQEWLNAIGSHDGTGVECPPLSDRELLEVFYDWTGGPGWEQSANWLTDAPLGDWYGVGTNADGEVTRLALTWNGLSGRLPPEIGHLPMLEVLNLWSNGIERTVPPELGRLTRLKYLDLSFNQFSGAIPPELGDLESLEQLWLEANEFSGPIPRELGNLPNLRLLWMYGNALTGTVPGELSGLGELRALNLSGNALTGTVPGELGGLSELEALFLNDNALTGTVPGELGGLSELETLFLNDNALTGLADEIGDLQSLEYLDVSGNRMSGPLPGQLVRLPRIFTLNLDRNDFSGAVPASYGGMATLGDLSASGNAELSGPLPDALTNLSLRSLVFGDTEVCAPDTRAFREWLHELPRAYVKTCGAREGTPVYLTQAVQSIDHPVPLVAGDSALLRVFVTANSSTSEPLPEVRARFYLGGSLRHTAEAARGTVSIPTTVDEGRLDQSVNIVVPASVIRPGLEMVVEVDPDGDVSSSLLGVRERIPASGRLELDVRDMPTLPLTIVPLLYEPDPDTAYAERAEELTDDHELLHNTRTLLPVEDIDVDIHERVWTSTRDWWTMAGEVDALRVAEGGVGYYMGIIEIRGGIAYGIGSWTSISLLDAHVMAHELGHNMYLRHAPCGGAGGPDPSYPHVRGSSGAWGYDFAAGALVDPADDYDLMSYCQPAWVSDYHFANATKRRLKEETENMAAAMAARSARVLLLWGGVDPDDNIVLEPAFVVDAPPVPPTNPGPYRITGRDGAGGTLFSVNFEMTEHLDGDGEAKGFVLALPVQPGWDALASIELEGPEGTVALDRDSGDPVTLLLDPVTGRARGFLRGDRTGDPPEPGLEALVSRGVPGGLN